MAVGRQRGPRNEFCHLELNLQYFYRYNIPFYSLLLKVTLCLLVCVYVCIYICIFLDLSFMIIIVCGCRSTCEELKVVIEQLEQERGVASKRARRLQDELQKVQQVTLSPLSANPLFL